LPRVAAARSPSTTFRPAHPSAARRLRGRSTGRRIGHPPRQIRRPRRSRPRPRPRRRPPAPTASTARCATRVWASPTFKWGSMPAPAMAATTAIPRSKRR
ncbi:MAG: hypothetical protein D6790_06120, partial [Caldilineae bacterium]